MADPFAEFDRIEAETKPIKKTIKGTEFEFPGACPADIALDLVTLIMANSGTDPVTIAATEMPKLLGNEMLEDLLPKVGWPGFQALTKGLFVHYGLLSEDTPSPNRKARRTSRSESSKSSARSEATSDASTGSASPTTSQASVGESS